MRKLRIISGIIIFITFSLFAAVQYNDPDPLVWILIYLTVAGFGVFSIFSTPHAKFLLPVIVMLLGASYMQWPHEYHGISMHMSYRPEIEEARESLGLLIGALALGWLYIASLLYKNSLLKKSAKLSI